MVSKASAVCASILASAVCCSASAQIVVPPPREPYINNTACLADRSIPYCEWYSTVVNFSASTGQGNVSQNNCVDRPPSNGFEVIASSFIVIAENGRAARRISPVMYNGSQYCVNVVIFTTNEFGKAQLDGQVQFILQRAAVR
jgi:hypothetical protein